MRFLVNLICDLLGWEDSMTTLQKFGKLNKSLRIHAILFRNAGVGFQFYEPPQDDPVDKLPDNWRDYLVVRRYYPTLIKAVNAEYRQFQRAKTTGKSLVA
jgi:hypothetical protein